MTLEEKLNSIYHFLEANREQNFRLHNYDFAKYFSLCGTNSEKAYSLLHGIYHTQQQPEMDEAADFFSALVNGSNSQKSLDSFSGFFNFLKNREGQKKLQKKYQNNSPFNYEGLFHLLSHQNGWGNKTAALFVKHIFQIHSDERRIKYIFWSDAPTEIKTDDRLFLPVDEVIHFIFEKITTDVKGFLQINKTINAQFKGNAVEVWDDLWFWGFITQQTIEKVRQLVDFNAGKYWALMGTEKNSKEIKLTQEKAKRFKQIIEKLS